MATVTQHWRDRAINSSETITDGWEVAKAWAARAAEIVLFICMIFNLLEMFPILPPWCGNVILIVQSITLDVAGFGLKTMGDHARRQGNEKAANTAQRMGWALITLMLITVSLVTLSILIPQTKEVVDWIEKALILARVGVTVLYSHITHGLRQARLEHENELSTLRSQVSTLQQEVSTLRPQVDSGHQQMDTLRGQMDTLNGQLQEKEQDLSTLQSKLSTALQKVSTLQADLQADESNTSTLRKQMNEALTKAEILRTQLEGKQQEVEGLREQLQSGQDWQGTRVANLQQKLEAEQAVVATLRREMNTVKIESDDLRVQLEGRQREVERVQTELSTEQQKVSTLRKKLDSMQVSTLTKSVDSGQSQRVSTPRTKLSSGHSNLVDSGHENGHSNVVHLDTSRRRNGQDEDALAEQIKEMILADPQLSDRSIATQLQCSPTTVGKKRRAMEQERAVNE